MNISLKRSKWLGRFGLSPFQCFVTFAVFLPPFCRADLALPNPVSARSISGQFAIIGARQVSPLADTLAFKTNSALVRLEPALLAVSAERIKGSICARLGIDGSAWHGQIFLALHPAQSLDDNVAVLSTRFNNAWIYRVDLPDIVSRTRLTRALTGVVLLEFANRAADNHCTQVPEWLIDGLSQLLLDGVAPEIVSLRDDVMDGASEDRVVDRDFRLDSLANARRILKASGPLTFGQMSWPTAPQLSGDDGGVYRASAQVFVSDLLDLKNGAADLRAMLQALPQFYNWQLAFRTAFQNDFASPLDVEKWWALQSVDFVSRGDDGPQWTPSVSAEKLDEILTVPIDYRAASNNLPMYSEISLQMAVGNFNPQLQADILREKVRELDLAQLQMAPQFAVLNSQYRAALADYLGDEISASTVSRWIKHPPTPASPRKTLERLDALDARRRALETTLDAAAQPALTERSPQL